MLSCHSILPFVLFFGISLLGCIDRQEYFGNQTHSTSRELGPAGASDDLIIDENSPVHFQSPCLGCHEVHRPPIPHVQRTDCAECHSYPNWATASSFSHFPAPVSCVSCHESHRPALPHVQNADCSSCHSFPSFANVAFSHTPKPETCENCHVRPAESNRAYPRQGTPADFVANQDYPGSGHFIGRDCSSCHLTPDEGANGFQFTHSQPVANFCLPCHYRDAVDEHRGDGFVQLSGFGNCFDCHRNFDRNRRRNFDD